MDLAPKQKKPPALKLEQIVVPVNNRQPSTITEQQNTTSTNRTLSDASQTLSDASQTKTTPTPLKKRGRKRKIPINIKYNDPEYVVMWPEICMAQRVLVDKYDNVYTYDMENPMWLGVKTVYGKIDNVTYKSPLTKYYFQ